MIVKIAGADLTVTNVNAAGTHWSPSKQCAVRRCLLFKATFSNLKGTDCYAWFFSTAAGAATSVAPLMVRLIPGGIGVSDTWDTGAGGKVFPEGLFILLSTTPAATPATVPTIAADDSAIFNADIRYDR